MYMSASSFAVITPFDVCRSTVLSVGLIVLYSSYDNSDLLTRWYVAPLSSITLLVAESKAAKTLP